MADEERFHFFPRYTISSLRLSGNDFDDVPEIYGSFRVIVECICVNLGIFCQIKVILPLMEHKFLWNALSGDQQNLIIFLVCYKTYIREPITRKNNSLFSIAIQVQGHKRNHDACALYSLFNSSRGWGNTSRYSSTLEVHSVFTSPPNLVSQRGRSKSGFRIEELDGESKCSVVQ